MAHRLGCKSYLGAFCLLILCMIRCNVTMIAAYISIDCGSGDRYYEDGNTRLIWENDENYVGTGPGLNGVVPNPVDSRLDNHFALQSFRYFPEWRSKHCYELVTRANLSILIRAMFLHGNSSKLSLPIVFDVYVNDTKWISVSYEIIGDLMTPAVHEGIFFAPGNTTYVCLVPHHGIPFISSLEVREFDTAGIMYSFMDKQTLFLTNVIRWYAGAIMDAPTLSIRHPDDNYDRLWKTPGGNTDRIQNFNYDDPGPLLFTNASTLPLSSLRSSSEVNNVPIKVMANAWTGYGFSIDVFPAASISYLYAVFYFLDLNSTSDSDERIMTISLDADTSPEFHVTGNISMLPFSHTILSTVSPYRLEVHVNPKSDSEPILSAVEIYQGLVFNQNSTVPDDVQLINFFKTTFDLANWGGDPCFPLPYAWITCTNKYIDPIDPTSYTVVESIKLSNLGNSSGLPQFAGPAPARRSS